LVIADIHEPISHPEYLKFCRKVRRKYRCDHIHFVGDVIDWTAISFHAKHPQCPGSGDEYDLAKEGVRKWYKEFPEATVCIGNHDRRPQRLASSVNIPEFILKDFNELWDTPGWEWKDDFIFDDVYFFHGEGYRGKTPALNASVDMGMNVVMGHTHCSPQICYRANPLRSYFGMDVGCGIDVDSYAMSYGKQWKKGHKPVLACGVIINGHPYLEVM
jgi:metallophosphoesterase superfamily enzyme